MAELDTGCDNFDDDDDLGDAEAIQALANAENSHDEKPQVQIKVLLIKKRGLQSTPALKARLSSSDYH